MADTSSASSTTEDAPPATPLQLILAEALGTFVLVFLGCGSASFLFAFIGSLGGGAGGAGLSAASGSLTFGFVLVAMIYAFGRISGGHFNPIVSVAAALSGRTPWLTALLAIAGQVAGAIVAGLALFILLRGYEDTDIGQVMLTSGFGDTGNGYALWATLLLELVLAFVFSLVWLAITDARNSIGALAPLAVGLAFTAVYALSLTVTGGSVNPARSIGINIFSGVDPTVQLWMFVFPTLIGGAAAGLLYPLVFGADRDPVPGSGLSFSSGTKSQQPAYGQYGYPGQPGQQGQPGAWSPQQGAPQAAQPAYQQQPAPIIQDGWQWDPQAQQWKPADQPQPPAQQAQQPWPDQEGRTAIRPPDGQ